MYYKNIHPDPKQPDRLYVMDVQAQVSEDGGALSALSGEIEACGQPLLLDRPGQHEPHPVRLRRRALRNLGPREHLAALHQPSAHAVLQRGSRQREPVYNVYGGTQDNNTLGGPSRSRGMQGSTNNDWIVVTGGDGFVSRIDPTDPNIVYGESSTGASSGSIAGPANAFPSNRSREKGGPAPLQLGVPFIISPHNPARLYFGNQHPFPQRRSRQQLARNQQGPHSPDRPQPSAGDGRIWPPEASPSTSPLPRTGI